MKTSFVYFVKIDAIFSTMMISSITSGTMNFGRVLNGVP